MAQTPSPKFNTNHGKQKTKINTKSRQKVKISTKNPNKTSSMKKSADTNFNEVKVRCF